MPKYKGIVISDVHVGAFDVEKLYKEYHDVFLNHISNMDKLDFLIIDGDFFDRKFYLNDKESIYSYRMIQELVDICKHLKTKIRIVYGTESHECNQYDILSILDLYDDMRIIKTVSEEELLPDLTVLYIPEEYILDKDEYYKDYFSNYNKYDYIFGHGTIQEIMSNAVNHMKSTSNKRIKVPVFSSRELDDICKGQVYFGHYHVNSSIDDKIFYCGSYSRWQFGEEEETPKGFYEIECDTKKNTYKNKFIVNNLCDVFKTIGFGYNSDIYDSTEKMEEALSLADNLIKKDIFDHVRFEFNIPSTTENPESTINYIKERYKFNDKVKVNIVHGYIAEKKEKQKEAIKEENQKYSFIYDKGLSMEDKVSHYIELKNERLIPSKRVYIYLNDDIDNIIEKINND